MVKVLVVGQTPPPHLGQAMMIQRLVSAQFDQVQIKHVRLAFSDEARAIGRISFKKIFHLFVIIYKIYKIRFSENNLILYYPPAGPNTAPVIRDLILLFFIRPFFPKTIYHFRAAGISEYLKGKSNFFQFISKKIYGTPDIGVQLSSLNPKDAEYFNAKKIVFIPNGLEDDALSYLPFNRQPDDGRSVEILFVGILREDKGLSYLVSALYLLKQKGVTNFRLTVMGGFNTEDYKLELMDRIASYDLGNYISFVGSQTGQAKWDNFSKADFLCFPTFFNSESFGNVLLEAMMFQLPVIATAWRGVPDIVTDETGFLIPIKNADILADKISLFLTDSSLRLKMGEQARKRFLEMYSLKQHLVQMEKMFLSLK
jgi:glycosyltransferase involved in cell wall biosynthesis